MKIRAVCTDIDGTLLDSNRELSPRTIAAIANIRHEVPIILASSRMPAAMYHLQKELGIAGHPMISYNGGYVTCLEGASPPLMILDSVKMPLSVCKIIKALTIGTHIHVGLFTEDEWYAPLNDQWTDRETRITKVSPSIMSFEDVMTKWDARKSGAHKVMCMGPEKEIAVLYHALEVQCPDEVHVYRSKSTYLEISPKIISKATGLQLVMKRRFNADLSEVMAFGDNYNDIDMIRSVGLGIAVGNAIAEVKEVAREITLNGKEDGVAVAIEKYFL